MGTDSASSAFAAALSLLEGWQTAAARRVRQTVGAVLRFGPVPQHIAFIMDGNRRFAERRSEDRAAGHTYGFYKVCCAHCAVHSSACLGSSALSRAQAPAIGRLVTPCRPSYADERR